MRLLLDSNAFIWAISQPAELRVAARRAITDADNERFVSISSLWEMTIKTSLGKLPLPDDFTNGIDHIGAALLPITVAHVRRLKLMPLHHRDPFDRMMIAQALEEGLTIVTRDRRFAAYGVQTLVT